jgi:hypothetical protein
MVTSRCCPSWVRPAVAEVQFHFEKVAAAKRSKCQSAGINPEIYRRAFDKRLSKKFDCLGIIGVGEDRLPKDIVARTSAQDAVVPCEDNVKI